MKWIHCFRIRATEVDFYDVGVEPAGFIIAGESFSTCVTTAQGRFYCMG
jgi:hypothetical protein